MTDDHSAVHDGTSREVLPFQVDLRGVVDLLSRHIYSSQQVFLRELLQNGADAITARRELASKDPDSASAGPSFGSIRISPVTAESDTLTVVDDGIGLTLAEVGDLLATVGRSSKRDIFDLPRGDYLGQFGIGLLSCFMVADRIVIRSRSATGAAPIEWIGSTDGTFTVRELSRQESVGLPIGTEVSLVPLRGSAELLGTRSVVSLATRFGEFLDIPIRVDLAGGGSETINRPAIFARPFDRPSADLAGFGRELIGATPFDAFSLTVPGTGTRGTAFVLPFAPAPGTRQASRVYLGGMLLAERLDDVMPDWAFFIRAVVDTTGLQPTASREQLVRSDALDDTREQLGQAVRRWILQLSAAQPHRLAEFVAIHHLALKAMIVHDDELAAVLIRWLTVETSNGVVTIDSLVRRGSTIRYADTVDEFRQIAGIASPDAPIVNGGYVYDTALLRRLPAIIDGVTVERVTVSDELDNLDSPPLAERAAAVALETRATAALAAVGCTAAVRIFEPADLPGLYVADADVLRAIERGKGRDVAPGVWGRVIGRVDRLQSGSNSAGIEAGSGSATAASTTAKLCLNWSSPLIRTLARLGDDAVFSRSVQVVYVQALLAGHRPLQSADRKLLTGALTDLVQLSVGLSETALPDMPSEAPPSDAPPRGTPSIDNTGVGAES